MGVSVTFGAVEFTTGTTLFSLSVAYFTWPFAYTTTNSRLPRYQLRQFDSPTSQIQTLRDKLQ
jgi:hypothetical protein